MKYLWPSIILKSRPEDYVRSSDILEVNGRLTIRTSASGNIPIAAHYGFVSRVITLSSRNFVEFDRYLIFLGGKITGGRTFQGALERAVMSLPPPFNSRRSDEAARVVGNRVLRVDRLVLLYGFLTQNPAFRGFKDVMIVKDRYLRGRRSMTPKEFFGLILKFAPKNRSKIIKKYLCKLEEL